MPSMKYIREYKDYTDLLTESTSYDLTVKDLGKDDYVVYATHGDNIIGQLNFIKSKFRPVLKGTSIVVSPLYRRRGIASAMYQFAEEELGIKFVRGDSVLTPSGKALWNNPNRKFGLIMRQDD